MSGRFNLLTLIAVMCGFWLLISGRSELWLLGLGAASAALTVWIAARLDAVDHEGHPLHLTWRGLGYWPWLAVEIVKANYDAAKTILGGRAAADPSVFTVHASQSDELGRTIYANSITLTPGTVTMHVDETGLMTIHALNAASRAGVESGEMDARVCKLMGDA